MENQEPVFEAAEARAYIAAKFREQGVKINRLVAVKGGRFEIPDVKEAEECD